MGIESQTAGSKSRRTALEVAVALGTTTTVSYGTLYYAFGVVARDMATDTGLSLTFVYGVFSFGLFLSGILAARAGKLFDQYDPATIMAVGSGLAALLLVLWTQLHGQWAYAIGLVALQTTTMLVLYEAAFVAAACYVPRAARRTITGITLIAGFASTIFWPLTAWLLEFWSWREIYLLFALLHLIFCLLPHVWLAISQSSKRRDADNGQAAMCEAAVQPRLTDKNSRKLAYLLLAFGFTAMNFVITSVHLHLIGILDSIGLAASAALIGAIIGPSQVAGRVVEFVLSSRLPMMAVTLFSASLLPAALLLLIFAGPWTIAAVIFAVMFGIGQGLAYIARGVLALELFGSDGFGHLTGRFNAFRLYISAGAPFVIAAVYERAGVTAAIYTIISVGLLALIAFLAVGFLLRKMPSPDCTPHGSA